MSNKRITIEEASSRLGMTKQLLRMNLQEGKFQFGTATKNKGKWTYYINGSRFEKYLRGEIWKNTHHTYLATF